MVEAIERADSSGAASRKYIWKSSQCTSTRFRRVPKKSNVSVSLNILMSMSLNVTGSGVL